MHIGYTCSQRRVSCGDFGRCDLHLGAEESGGLAGLFLLHCSSHSAGPKEKVVDNLVLFGRDPSETLDWGW